MAVPTGSAPNSSASLPNTSSHAPDARSAIVRSATDGDLVFLHVHSTGNPQDRGNAIVDIFRVEHGKIAEHWDVIEPVPERSGQRPHNVLVAPAKHTVCRGSRLATDSAPRFNRGCRTPPPLRTALSPCRPRRFDAAQPRADRRSRPQEAMPAVPPERHPRPERRNALSSVK